MPRHLLRYPFFLLALLLFMAACQRQQKKAPIAELPPVSIAIANKKEIPQILSSVAVVEPYHTVSIRARVTGELINVHFQEGHFVKKVICSLRLTPDLMKLHWMKQRQLYCGIKHNLSMTESKTSATRT